MKPKIIVGIDPSLNNIGVGVIPVKKQLKNGQPFLTIHIAPSKRLSLQDKLVYNLSQLDSILHDLQTNYEIEAIVIEEPSHHYHRGRKVSMKALFPYIIGVGAIIGFCAFSYGRVVLYHAPSGKSGLKTKNKAMIFLQQIGFDVDLENYSDHELDALVLAVHYKREVLKSD